MSKDHEETKKILKGLLVGAVGAGALYYMLVKSHRKPPMVQRIGKTISEVGDMIEHCHFDGLNRLVASGEKKLPKAADAIDTLSEWVSSTRSLWKELTK